MKKVELLALSIILFAFFTGCQLLYPPGVYEDVVQGQGRARIYVSVNKGDDNNPGTSMDKPVKSIQKGLDLAGKDRNVIYVTAATYSPGNGLNTNNYGANIYKGDIMLFGGFDENFTSRTGRTILDGNGSLYHVLMAANINNLTMDGFVLQNGNANGVGIDSAGGGLLLQNVNNSRFLNSSLRYNQASLYSGIAISSCSNLTMDVVVSNNQCTGGKGGGVGIFSSYGITMLGVVSYNLNSTGDGGGLFIENSTNTIVSSLVENNAAGGNGGGIYINNCVGSTINSSSVSYNSSGIAGGGIYVFNSYSNIISGSINSNISAGNGGGICIISSVSNMISSKVYNNSVANGISTTSGGGVYMASSDFTIINGDISYNNSGWYGGGIALQDVTNLQVLGKVDNNTASTNGGGISLLAVTANSFIFIDAEVIGNQAPGSTGAGGGIYNSGAFDSITISGNISGNYAAGEGGGIFVSAGFGQPNDLSINNANIATNYSGGTSASVIFLAPMTYTFNSIFISGCTIGGVSTSMTGVYYQYLNTINNLTIVNNTFLGNDLNQNSLFNIGSSGMMLNVLNSYNGSTYINTVMISSPAIIYGNMLN